MVQECKDENSNVFPCSKHHYHDTRSSNLKMAVKTAVADPTSASCFNPHGPPASLAPWLVAATQSAIRPGRHPPLGDPSAGGGSSILVRRSRPATPTQSDGARGEECSIDASPFELSEYLVSYSGQDRAATVRHNSRPKILSVYLRGVAPQLIWSILTYRTVSDVWVRPDLRRLPIMSI